VEQNLQNSLFASWILYINISAVVKLAPDLIDRWDKIFRIVQLLYGYYL